MRKYFMQLPQRERNALKRTVSKYFKGSVINISTVNMAKIRKKHNVSTMAVHHAANRVILGMFPPSG